MLNGPLRSDGKRWGGVTVPALTYYDARRRVAAKLARNGRSVDALFGW